MLLVYDTFTEMIAYISGGPQAVLRNTDLVTGFYSPMANRICDPEKANFLKGDAIYYSPFVTPSITNFMGPAAESTLTVYTGNSTGQQEDSLPGRIIAQNGVGFPNTIFVAYDSVKLVYTQEPIKGAPLFKDVPAFDGMQNAPVYSVNTTNTTSTYVFDENNVMFLNLTFLEDGTSSICLRGRGDECYGEYNKFATVERELNPGQMLDVTNVAQAYGLPVGAEQYVESHADTHSGYSTKNRQW